MLSSTVCFYFLIHISLLLLWVYLSKQKWGATQLIGLGCVEWLVGNNVTNNSLNELFNYCLYLVLDLLDISGIICGTWFCLYESSLIVWSKSASYIQFSSSDIILSQMVDHNIVFNHNFGCLYQLQFCCRW